MPLQGGMIFLAVRAQIGLAAPEGLG